MISRQRLHDAKRKAKRRVPTNVNWGDEATYQRHLRFARKTTKLCSCLCCGNYRRTLKGKERLTLQERRQKGREDGA